MRVIAGQRRGTRLFAPSGEQTRPTSDRVREALFSILGSPHGMSVLDLFAGSGALGIEALSRGAAAATFVDSSAIAVAAIRRNLAAARLEGDVRRLTAIRFLQWAQRHVRQYDLIFIDPPYRLASVLSPELGAALTPVLRPGARVVTESDRRRPLELELPLLDERRYGQTLIRIHDSR